MGRAHADLAAAGLPVVSTSILVKRPRARTGGQVSAIAGSAEEPRLLCSVEEGVATLTLNLPARLNAIDHGPGSLHRELGETLERLDHDDTVRCSIITGSGRAFSSGGDLGRTTQLEGARDYYWFHREEEEDNERLRRVRKPTIGAINGICYGAALMMAAHLDILVAAEGARLGLLETRFGATGVNVLAYHVGPQWAKFLAFGGELLSAGKAQEIGLVLAVFPEERFASKVADLARRVASLPHDAVQLNKRVVDGAMDHMGWGSQGELSIALNSIASSEMRQARAADGRLFSELREEGWDAYKNARDAPFMKPWLEG